MFKSCQQIFDKCRNKSVPKRQVCLNRRRTSPPWTTEVVKEVKHELNKAQKSFKRRSTEQNYHKLQSAKVKYDEAVKVAKDQCVERICGKLSSTKDPKELWNCFRSLTSYQNLDGCDVLPLLDGQNLPRFHKDEKCQLLQGTFFSGKHLEQVSFDNVFQSEIERELETIRQQGETEGDNQNTAWLNDPITREETAAALGSLVKGKAAGMDGVFSELLLSAGDKMITAVHSLFQESYENGQVHP
jgi:hypothetical protein